MSTYINREPVRVQQPKELQGRNGELRYTCTPSRTVIISRVCELSGELPEQIEQSGYIGSIESIIRSLEVLRSYGALEICIDGDECSLFAELDVMRDSLKKSADKDLVDLHVNMWKLKHDYPKSRYKLRVEMRPEIKIVSPVPNQRPAIRSRKLVSNRLEYA